MDGVHNGIDDPAVRQEMLAEAFACDVSSSRRRRATQQRRGRARLLDQVQS
jgi:hypothetical protein